MSYYYVVQKKCYSNQVNRKTSTFCEYFIQGNVAIFSQASKHGQNKDLLMQMKLHKTVLFARERFSSRPTFEGISFFF